MDIQFIMSPAVKDSLFFITKQNQEKPTEKLIEELEKYLIEKNANDKVLLMTKKEFLGSLELAFAKGNNNPINASSKICNGLSRSLEKIRKGDKEKLTAIFNWIKTLTS